MVKATLTALKSGKDANDAWLSAALKKPVAGVQVKLLGVGESSDTYRATFHEANNPSKKGSVVLKVASEKEESRQHGIKNGGYEREVQFYREFGNKFDAIPKTYATVLDDDGFFTIVMEDFPGCTQIDNTHGTDLETSKAILSAMATISGPKLGDWMWAGPIAWLQKPQQYNGNFVKKIWPTFERKHGNRLPKRTMDLLRWFGERADAWESSVVPPLGICHNDLRLDNVLFHNGKVIIIDWATVGWNPFMRDVAYYCQTSLTKETWDKHGRTLVDFYLQELDKYSEISINRDMAWKAFAYQTFHCTCLLVGAMGSLDLSARGAELGYIMLETAVNVILDVDAKRAVEETIEYASVPLEPAPTDDNLHPVAPGEKYNESFYFDVHSPDATQSVYVRYGRLPNQNKCLFYAAILHKGHPTYIIDLTDAPLPKADDRFAEFNDPDCWYKQEIIEPLKKVRLQLKGKANAYKDPTAPLWGFAGEPKKVDIAFDLLFEQVGKTMMWRITPRWEAPADTKGTYSIDGEQFEIDGWGQRDHSWGMRDWWSTNPFWSDLHLEDGTRIQCMTEWIHHSFQQGYTQKHGKIVEHTSCRIEADWDLRGLLKKAKVTLQPGNLEITATPKMQSGHRLTGPEGRATAYPRVVCSLETKEGVKGVGMLEWFFVQNYGPPPPKKTTGSGDEPKSKL